MKYLNNSAALTKEFKRLLNAYDNYYWMVAWAGSSFPLTEDLAENSEKIKRLVVGLHFFQTHPTFIEQFNPHEAVRFIKSTAGTFHPKVYLFANDEENWELIIGSSNFTSPGFSTNTEASLLIKSDDSSTHLYKEILASIADNWQKANKFDAEELKEYRIAWTNQQSKINSLAGFSRTPTQTPFHRIPNVKMGWREYIQRVRTMNHEIGERIKVLDIIQNHFRNYPVFADMPDEFRKEVGGYLSSKRAADFRLFGNMQNAASFKNTVNENPEGISNALDEIPSTGPVAKAQFDSFVTLYNAALGGGNKYVSGTRLLAMKRPDIFFGLTQGNNDRLALDFDIPTISTMNFERYWNEIITAIYDSDWWQNPAPQDELERNIVKYRAAFLDVLYFNPATDIS